MTETNADKMDQILTLITKDNSISPNTRAKALELIGNEDGIVATLLITQVICALHPDAFLFFVRGMKEARNIYGS